MCLLDQSHQWPLFVSTKYRYVLDLRQRGCFLNLHYRHSNLLSIATISYRM
jgi:hypothetical protein